LRSLSRNGELLEFDGSVASFKDFLDRVCDLLANAIAYRQRHVRTMLFRVEGLPGIKVTVKTPIAAKLSFSCSERLGSKLTSILLRWSRLLESEGHTEARAKDWAGKL
jgi:hypothetical protein